MNNTISFLASLDEETLNGKKVKINVDNILNSNIPKSKKFTNFIKKHKNDVFTAHDIGVGTKFTGIMYELEEDESPVKWLFCRDYLIEAE